MVEDEKIEPICLLSVEVVRIHIPIVSVLSTFPRRERRYDTEQEEWWQYNMVVSSNST